MADRFRPVNWADISKPGAPIVGWGLQRKAHGEHRYRPVGWQGQVHPFKTEAEAQRVCDELNATALTTQQDTTK